MQKRCNTLNAFSNILLRNAVQLQAKGNVIKDVQVRKQRVILEHHGQVSLGWMDIGDVLAIEHDFAAADGFETANGTKERTLSASRGSDKDDEFLFFNLKIDVLKSVKSFVIFLDLSQFQISHRVKPLKVRFFWGANNAGWVTAARKRFDISHIPQVEALFFYSFCTQIFTNGGVTRMVPVGTRSCAIRRCMSRSFDWRFCRRERDKRIN